MHILAAPQKKSANVLSNLYICKYICEYICQKSTRHFWCFAPERQIASLRMHYNMLTEYKYLKDIIITKYILFCIKQCLFFLLNWAWAYWFRAEMNYRVISKRFALSLCTCTMYTHYICLHNSNLCNDVLFENCAIFSRSSRVIYKEF